jgi:hypothetical protein
MTRARRPSTTANCTSFAYSVPTTGPRGPWRLCDELRVLPSRIGAAEHIVAIREIRRKSHIRMLVTVGR